jgi:hypothetical protein
MNDEARGLRLDIRHDGDQASFVRVLATLVNPTPVYLASTLRGEDGWVRCTFMVRHRSSHVEQCLVDDVVNRVTGRYVVSDVELISSTGSPVATRAAVDTAA